MDRSGALNLTDFLPVLYWLHRKTFDVYSFLDQCIVTIEDRA